MLEIDIPGFGPLRIAHLVLDYNGTIAFDGALIEGVQERLFALAPKVEVHVLTADTFGGVQRELAGSPAAVHVLGPGGEDRAKLGYVRGLGIKRSACMGNGRNDSLMLAEAALGVAVLGPEGLAIEAAEAADLVAPSILDALDLLIHPLRLIATLRT